MIFGPIDWEWLTVVLVATMIVMIMLELVRAEQHKRKSLGKGRERLT